MVVGKGAAGVRWLAHNDRRAGRAKGILVFRTCSRQLMHSLWRLLPKSVAGTNKVENGQRHERGRGAGAGAGAGRRGRQGSAKHSQLDTFGHGPAFTYLSLVLTISPALIINLCVYLIY